MVGVINHWDILAHPVVTIRCFGWGVFFRAIGPWQSKPFLSLLRDTGHFGAADSKAPAILERCVGLELRAKAIYKAFARTFADKGLVAPFFAGLAEQEQHHADLLELGRAVAIRSGWKAHLFNPWDDFLPRLERQMAAAEAAVSKIDAVEAALRLVVQIEGEEELKLNLPGRQQLDASNSQIGSPLKFRILNGDDLCGFRRPGFDLHGLAVGEGHFVFVHVGFSWGRMGSDIYRKSGGKASMFICGDHDSHPAEGVGRPLAAVIAKELRASDLDRKGYKG